MIVTGAFLGPQTIHLILDVGVVRRRAASLGGLPTDHEAELWSLAGESDRIRASSKALCIFRSIINDGLRDIARIVDVILIEELVISGCLYS